MLVLGRRPNGDDDALQVLLGGQHEQRMDHAARIALGTVYRRHGDSQTTQIVVPVGALGAHLDEPVPAFGRQGVRPGASDRHGIGGRNRVAGFLIHQTQLILGVVVQDPLEKLIMGARIVQIAHVSPSSLLDGRGAFAQVWVFRPRADY